MDMKDLSRKHEMRLGDTHLHRVHIVEYKALQKAFVHSDILALRNRNALKLNEVIKNVYTRIGTQEKLNKQTNLKRLLGDGK